MSLIRNFALATVVALAPSISLAAPMAADDYMAVDINFDATRSIWTPNGGSGPSSNAFVQGNGASAFWSFSNSSFDYNGTSASLTGTATNTGNAALSFSFDLQFDNAQVGSQAGYCQFGGGRQPCSNFPTVDPTEWTFFDFTSGTFTGTGDMDGLSYNLTQKSGHNAQAGTDANALELLGNLGFSMWFDWTKTGMATTTTAGYTFNTSGNGDLNFDLVEDPNGGGTGVVPLPAAGWLLLAGIGGLAAANRRKIA